MYNTKGSLTFYNGTSKPNNREEIQASELKPEKSRKLHEWKAKSTNKQNQQLRSEIITLGYPRIKQLL